MEVVYNLHEIEQVATQIIANVKDKKVWAFSGQMGAGKTTLIHAICNQLSIVSPFGSPTYSIINEYATADKQTIYHMDWYRLKNEDEAIQAGVEDVMLSGNLCLVEWPERAAVLLPTNTCNITITLKDDGSRMVSIT